MLIEWILQVKMRALAPARECVRGLQVKLTNSGGVELWCGEKPIALPMLRTTEPCIILRGEPLRIGVPVGLRIAQ